MKTLRIDLETYCELDLTEVGVYKYAEHYSFEILLFGYAYDDEPVSVIDIASGEKVPASIVDDLIHGTATVSAFNANFERVCLSHWIARTYSRNFYFLNPKNWRCSMVQSLYHGMPGKLDTLTKALSPDKANQKMSEGKDLIRYFCQPCKPTKANGGRIRNLPEHAPEKWELFKTYNKTDVEVERKASLFLNNWPVPQHIWDRHILDQIINDRGVQVDEQLARSATKCAEMDMERLIDRTKEITGLENPNSEKQIKSWLLQQGIEAKSIDKEHIDQLLKGGIPGNVREFLHLRQSMAKASIKKYGTILGALNADSRIRGALQFYGAHSGRWSGRLYQLHNLVRITAMLKDLSKEEMETDLDYARSLIKTCEFELAALIYGSLSMVVSNLVRTVLVAKPRCKFINCDMSQIEARLLAWAAENTWALEAFQSGKDIYIAVAEQMYRVPAGTIVKGDERRQRGKTTQLACGYQGSVGAMRKMDKEKALKEEEMLPLVKQWRKANPKIVAFWRDLESAALQAVKGKTTVQVTTTLESASGNIERPYPCNIRFVYDRGFLRMELPSGRSIFYARPEIEVNEWGKEAVTYQGVDGITKQWVKINAYGGMYTAHAIQGLAWDIICMGVEGAEAAGYKVILTIHDEILAEVPENFGSAEELIKIMSRIPDWAPGLPLAADGGESKYYHK